MFIIRQIAHTTIDGCSAESWIDDEKEKTCVKETSN